MKFMVIVKATPESESGALPSTELLTAMGKYNEELAQAGILLAGEGLHPSSRGARVRFSGANRSVIDGPFTETKELIAGYWLWRVGSIQEAIDWVKKCPNPMNENSDIEIRQVFEVEDFGESFTPELRRDNARLLARTLGLKSLRFEATSDRLISGSSRHYTAETRETIPQHWAEFVQQAGRISGRLGADYFAVVSNTTSACEFDYLCGVEVASGEKPPSGMTRVKLDARPWVVFTHAGHVSTLPKTIELIWSKWAPDCGLDLSKTAPSVERYTSEFNPTTGTGGIELWVPLDAD